MIRIAVEDLGAHLATLESELSGVQSIVLTRGATEIAEVRALKPEEPIRTEPSEMPDFMARLRAVWGDTPGNFDTTAWIREDREERS